MKRVFRLCWTVFLINLFVFSSFASDRYVYDEAGLLRSEEAAALENMAASVADTYDCGVYVITMTDYREYSRSDVFTTATELYHGMKLGEGASREGILLLLSMRERDYATFFYGDSVEYAFEEYGQIQLEEQFLDDFRNNQWFDGFYDYITVAGEYLGLAASGNPVRESHAAVYLGIIAVSMLISLMITFGLKLTMRSVKKGGSAVAYMSAEGLNLTQRIDYFLYNTQTRRRIESSSNRSGSGSRSHRGGGGSGRSGKF